MRNILTRDLKRVQKSPKIIFTCVLKNLKQSTKESESNL